MKLLPILLLLSIFSNVVTSTFHQTPSTHSLTFTLHRRPHAPIRSHHYRELAGRDALRQRAIAGTVWRRRRVCDDALTNGSSFTMPLISGAYVGTGEYFVRVLVGTPAQKFSLIADTGSDLTWMKCAGGGGGGRRGRVFRPEKSSSFQSVKCSSDLCKTGLPFSVANCSTPDSPCVYEYSYSDGSVAKGIYANESATIIRSNGRHAKLHGLIVGCTSSAVGSSFQAADGVLGLGYSDISFASRATKSFGGRFSYCLVDHLSPRNATSSLTFGPSPAFESLAIKPLPQSAQLLLDPRLEPFYSVAVKGISVNGTELNISASVWDVNNGGGTIIDSGTSLTVLAAPAYNAVVEALSRWFEDLPRVSIEPFEYCYQWKEPREIPKLVVNLQGTARIEPPWKSYIISVADGVRCLGFVSAPWPGLSTIGNILQQEHAWEYDLKDRRLRFRRTNCESH